jgi:hypothetical protein
MFTQPAATRFSSRGENASEENKQHELWCTRMFRLYASPSYFALFLFVTFSEQERWATFNALG